jgi:hypothetical protein
MLQSDRTVVEQADNIVYLLLAVTTVCPEKTIDVVGASARIMDSVHNTA